MKQTPVLGNACGIIASIHGIFNSLDLDTDLAEDCILKNFYNDCQGKTPLERADILDANDAFKKEHKKNVNKGQTSVTDAVNHHFICFILNDKQQLVEMNGLLDEPRVCKEQASDLLRETITIVQERLQ
jgi:ubiquitin carboxyl-terminal hydrolase L3